MIQGVEKSPQISGPSPWDAEWWVTQARRPPLGRGWHRQLYGSGLRGRPRLGTCKSSGGRAGASIISD